jgi:hypothetical protein
MANRFLLQSLWIAGVFVSVWAGLGRLGYRAGQLVTLGPAAIDPELVRGLLAALAAVIGGQLSRVPFLDLIRQTLVHAGLSSPLTPDEQRDAYERIKRMEERTRG